MPHQANVRTICRSFTIPKGGNRYFVGEFTDRISKCRSSTEISGSDCWLFDLFKVFVISDSNGFTVIVLYKVNSSIVGPDIFPSKSFSSFIGQVKQVFVSFGNVFIDENTFSGRFS